jgi:hypothetical protein
MFDGSDNNQGFQAASNDPANEPSHDAILGDDAHTSMDLPDPTSAPAAPSDPAPAASTSSDELINIKQQALQQLSPLVSHLEQTPEEKFRTIMMMIQASDNQALIKDAYEATQAITDDKSRAQALLDVVNEINYFTQHSDS